MIKGAGVLAPLGTATIIYFYHLELPPLSTYYLKKVSEARLLKSGLHPISPKTPSPQYQSTEWIAIKGKQYMTNRERTALDNKKALSCS